MAEMKNVELPCRRCGSVVVTAEPAPGVTPLVLCAVCAMGKKIFDQAVRDVVAEAPKLNEQSREQAVRECNAYFLEELAQRVRRGDVTKFRLNWDGDGPLRAGVGWKKPLEFIPLSFRINDDGSLDLMSTDEGTCDGGEGTD